MRTLSGSPPGACPGASGPDGPLGTGPSTSACPGSDAASSNATTASAGPVRLAIRTDGGNRSWARSASSRSEWVTGIPADQCLHCRDARIRDDHHHAARRGGTTSAAAFIQRRRASSAARRPGRPRSTQPSSSNAAAYPPAAPGSAPGWPRQAPGRRAPPGSSARRPKSAAAPLGRRGQVLPRYARLPSPGRGPSGARTGASPGRIGGTAPPAAHCGGRPFDSQRPTAGLAAGPVPAPLAASSRHVPAPRHLDQDRPAAERLPRRSQGQAGQPGRPRCLVPGQFGIGARSADLRGAVPQPSGARR